MFFRLAFLFLITFPNYAISSAISPDYDPNNTFILRLGSCPFADKNMGYPNKEDNSYRAWKKGGYKKRIVRNGIPFKNIIHNYITEFQPEAKKWKTTPVRTHINGIKINKLEDFDIDSDRFDPKEDPEPTYITVDFNSDQFNSGISQLMINLNNPECLFDCIITDEKTTKFVLPSGLSNLISQLKIGGIAIFTDLDEDYGWQFDEDCMFCKQSNALFDMFCKTSDGYENSKVITHYSCKRDIELLKETGLTTEEAIDTLSWPKDMLAEFQLPEDKEMFGLFDLVFGECSEREKIDSEYLRHYGININSDIKLRVKFFNSLSDFIEKLSHSTFPSKNVVKYFLRLGNKETLSNNLKTRVIILEGIG